MMINNYENIEVKCVTPLDGHYFFGYYDISPESPDGSRILVNRVSFIERMPEVADALEVGYIDADTLQYTKIGQTYAWNFQEGCRLQWLDSKKCIYNIREGHAFKSVVFDIEQGCIERTYNVPIYSVMSERKIDEYGMKAPRYALTYSFTNNKYCYAHTETELAEDFLKDGVYLLNLESGEYKRIISNATLDELANLEQSNGHVEYCVFNDKGDKFYLYYRWSEDNGATYTMLCVSDLNGNVNTLLKSNFLSHAGWCGNGWITVWGRLPNGMNMVQNSSFLKNTGLWKMVVGVFHKVVKSDRLRQKFTNDAYIMFDVNSGSNYKIENNNFTSDGHCTWSLGERWMLTDTYPDQNDDRHLMIYDSHTDKIIQLGKFYSYPKNMKEKNNLWNSSPMRCDLHPKWGSGKYIYFDSVHEGSRSLYRIDISEITKG